MASSLAIYIGTENVDVVSLSGSFPRPHLVSFARAKLPQQGSWREQVRVEGPQPADTPRPPTEGSDSEEMSRSLEAILAKLGGPFGQAYVAIASESVVIRCFQMPNIPAHERKMAIAFEAKKYLPFKLEELVTDYSVITRRSDPTLMRVMFFGVKKSSISIYSSLFQSNKLTPLCIEPAPLCLMRMVRQNGQLPLGQVVAILSMEHDSATISIARDDLLYLSRNVTILHTAEPVQGTPSELLEALLNETRVSIDYYRRRFLGEPTVNKILVFGKPEDQARIQELFGTLELPVEIGDPYKKMSGGKMAPAGLGIAIGLALRGLDSRPGGINVLPPEQRRASQGLLKLLTLQVTAAVVSLALWYGFSFADLKNYDLRLSELRAQQLRDAQIQADTSLQQLKEIRVQRAREKQFLTALSNVPSYSSSLLVELGNLMPRELWLQHTWLRNVSDLDPQKAGSSLQRFLFRITGDAYANDRKIELEKVNQFLGAVQENSVFKSCFSKFSIDSFQRSSYGKEEITEFRLTCASRPEDLNLLNQETTGRGGRRSRP